MASRSTYEIMKEMQATAEAKANPTKAGEIHPDTFSRVLEMQQERVPCLFCGAITNLEQEVDYRGGTSVFTRYRCPRCTHTFMEKDIHEPKD